MQMYMNIQTGSIDYKEGWDYVNELGETVNAVDLDEVVEVHLINGEWSIK